MMPTRRTLALLVTLLIPVVISLLLPAIPASAQTTGTTTVSVVASVVPTGITHSKPRSGPNLLVNQINYADCINDDQISVPVTTTGASAYTLQAWMSVSGASQDCTAVAARSGATIACWLVASTIPAANTTSTLVQIPVRAIVAGFTENLGIQGTGVTDTSSTGGTSSTDAGVSGSGGSTAGTGTTSTTTGITTGFSAPIMPGVEACNQTAVVTTATQVAIEFMLIDPGTGNAVTGQSDLTMLFKLVGPQPPASVSAGVGGNLLVTTFDSSAETTADLTINTYNVYCDPPPGAASAMDAGLLALDAGSGTAGDCSDANPSILQQGNQPPPGAAICGSAQRTSQTANASGLIDGVPYHVGVAAVDTYYNVGVLSNIACGVPQPINGFYKNYRAAGGTAGGGFCSFSMKREPTAGIAFLALACGIVIRRRRKK